MELILLPHHNTVTLIQKLQDELCTELQDEKDMRFLASYPLVCVLGHTDEAVVSRGKLKCQPLQLLKDMLKNADGTISFRKAPVYAEKSGQILLPAGIPFMDLVKAAGFEPENAPHFVLGRQFASYEESDGTAYAHPLPQVELPAESRSFRLALMEAKPAFSWKFHQSFWVKLR